MEHPGNSRNFYASLADVRKVGAWRCIATGRNVVHRRKYRKVTPSTTLCTISPPFAVAGTVWIPQTVGESTHCPLGKLSALCTVWMVSPWRRIDTGMSTTRSRSWFRHPPLCTVWLIGSRNVHGWFTADARCDHPTAESALRPRALSSCSPLLAAVTRHTEITAVSVRRRPSVQGTCYNW